MALPIRPNNPNVPIPNNPFYSPEDPYVEGAYFPIALGAGIDLTGENGLPQLTNDVSEVLAAGPGIGLTTTGGITTISVTGVPGGAVTQIIPGTNISISPVSGIGVVTVNASGSVSQVNTGSGLIGGPITSTGTISLDNSGVTAGSYNFATVQVDQYGRVTLASTGIPVTSVTAGTGLTGGTITSTGTIALDVSGVTAGTYTYSTVTVDTYGRVTVASSGVDPVTSLTGTAPIQVTGTIPSLTISVDPASTTGIGVVQLEDTTTSTSTTLALTANQGKILQDQINALTIASNITLAGTLNASTGNLDSVTAEGTLAGFAVGSPLPAAAASNDNYFVIATAPAASYTPPGGSATQVHVGDWFLSDGAAWQFLDVGFDPPYASDTIPGIVELATAAETQAGTDGTRAVTPLTLQSKMSDATNLVSSTTIASSTAVKTTKDVADAALPKAGGTMSGIITFAPAQTFPGTVTCVGTTAAFTGGPITCTGTLDLAVTGVTAGTYNYPASMAVDACGRITALGASSNPVTEDDFQAKGDLISGYGVNSYGVLTAGTDGTLLVANSACASGLEWKTVSSVVPSALPTVEGKVYGCTTDGDLSRSNSFLGYLAGNSTTTGSRNVAVGTRALASTTTGSSNVAVGECALVCNVSGSLNVAFGRDALQFLTGGSYNVGLGYAAGGSTTTGSYNLAIGAFAAVADPAADYQLAIASGAKIWLRGDCSCAIQPGAGIIDCAGSCGTGVQVLASDGANAICWRTICSATPTVEGLVYGLTRLGGGGGDAFIGHCAGNSLTSGLQNVGVGQSALRALETGKYNTAVGALSLINNVSGWQNTTLGNLGLSAVTTGSCNIGIGLRSGCNITTGCNNVTIGNCVQVASGTGDCQLAIGFSATENWLTGDSTKAIKPGAGIIDCAGSCGTAEQMLVSNGANAVCWKTPLSSITAVSTALTGGTITTTGSLDLAVTGVTAGLYNYPASVQVDACGRITSIGPSTSPVTESDFLAKGDLIAGTGVNVCSALSVGVNGTVLVANSACTTGLEWQPVSNAIPAATPVLEGRVYGCTDPSGYNSFLGYLAGNSTTTASRNVAVGTCALASATTGHSNVAVGDCALFCNVGGPLNVAIGRDALLQSTGGYNIGLGYGAGTNISTGNYNVTVGNLVSVADPAADYQLAIGTVGGWWLRGDCDFAIKPAKGIIDCAGSCGTAVQVLASDGANAICWRTICSATPTVEGLVYGSTLTGLNSFLGHCAGCSVTSGQENVGVGESALCTLQTGRSNTAVGYLSLVYNVGSENTALGHLSLSSSTTGCCNIGIGRRSGCNITTGCNNVAIGNCVQVASGTGDCQLAIGFSATCNWLTGTPSKAIQPGAGIIDCAGSCGTAGQVLTSNGSNAIVWGTRVCGVTGTAPITVNNTDAENPIIGVSAASTSAAGVVQLNNTTTSTSATEALTAAQGKNLQDQINTLSVTSNITLAGTLDTATGNLVTVTTAGSSAGFSVGSPLPAAAAGNAEYFVIVTVGAASYTPPGGTATLTHVGDWFLSNGSAWEFLDVGFQAPSASTTTPGIVELADNAETQAGTNADLAVTPTGLQSKVSDSVSTASSTSIASSQAVKDAYDLAAAAVPCSALVAKGDLIAASGASTPTALPVGTDGQILSANSACSSGLEWTTPPTPPVIPIGATEYTSTYTFSSTITQDLISFSGGRRMGTLTIFGSNAAGNLIVAEVYIASDSGEGYSTIFPQTVDAGPGQLSLGTLQLVSGSSNETVIRINNPRDGVANFTFLWTTPTGGLQPTIL